MERFLVMYLVKTKISPFYQVIYFREGKRTQISTKTALKSQALKFLTEFEQQIKKKEVKPIVQLESFRDEYLEFISKSKSKKYIKAIQLAFKMLIEYTGNIELNRIDRRLAEKFISITFQRTESGAAMYYRTLKAGFSVAENWNYIESNPFRKIRTPKPKMNLPAYLTENDFNFLLGFITEPLLRDFYSILFFTGLRAGEGCNLQFSDLNFQQKTITIQNKENFSTKSRRERIVPMNQIVYEILKNKVPKIYSLNKNHYVFWLKFPSVSLSVDYVSKKFKKAIRKSGLNPKLHLHSLRHSFCSNLVNAGVNLSTIGALAGHHSTKVTEIYSHVSNSSLFQAVELLNRADSVCAGGSFGS